EGRHEERRVPDRDREPDGDRRRMLAERQRHEEERCEQERAPDDALPRRRLDLAHGTARAAARRLGLALRGRLRGALLLLGIARLVVDLVALGVDPDFLVLVPALLLPAALLLLRRHGDLA